MDEVGITTTLPVEVLLAAGLRPVDLNNRFITCERAAARVELAERRGFPRGVCAWVKGIYATVHEEGIRTVVGVTQGDCSLTHALLELLQDDGVEVFRFEFPYDRDASELAREIGRLESRFGVTRSQTEEARAALSDVRGDLRRIDELMSRPMPRGFAREAHAVILSGSDLGGGDPNGFSAEARRFLEAHEGEAASEDVGGPRLALAGVPPIVDDLFEHVERAGARICLGEMAREFAMLRPGSASVVEQYRAYTYPYGVFYRAEQLAAAVRRRGIAGVIHYVQTFCYRSVQDRILRDRVGVPVLTLECDRPGALDERSVSRIEAFVEMLEAGGTGHVVPS
jgi:benzoyl-CoA reductase/2-hydroxyglutaryl-CoA dehydratase subunit BcrC/BadD/HgdB